MQKLYTKHLFSGLKCQGPLKTGKLPWLGNLYGKWCNREHIDLIEFCKRSHLLAVVYIMITYLAPWREESPSRAEQGADTVVYRTSFLLFCSSVSFSSCSSSFPYSSSSHLEELLYRFFTCLAINIMGGESNKSIQERKSNLTRYCVSATGFQGEKLA